MPRGIPEGYMGEKKTGFKNDAGGPSRIIPEDWQKLWGSHQTFST